MRSLLGLCGYYRWFIKDYGHLVISLQKLLTKAWNTKINSKKPALISEPIHEETFKKLKKALTSAPALAFPSVNDKFILDTDASHVILHVHV